MKNFVLRIASPLIPNKDNSKFTIKVKFLFAATFLTGLYVGSVYGAYSWIKAILQDIDRLKIEYANKIAELKAQIVALNMQIDQEWIRINEFWQHIVEVHSSTY